jgi:hypothetical protein
MESSKILKRYKLVVREVGTGKVIQVHEVYRAYIEMHVLEELDKGYSVTVTEL